MKMASMNISLPQEMRRFVEAKVASGEFGTASEYLRALIRAAQREDAAERAVERSSRRYRASRVGVAANG